MLKGLQKLTLLDFPGKIACTVFFGGCNFRCPFCHNASLVLGEKLADSPTMQKEDFFKFLELRRGILEGVCISGGEPTLYPKLPKFIKSIRDMGFLIKLDTNGSNPDMLESLILDGLVDYVAMDIKNSPEKYAETVGVSDYDISPIKRSAEILMRGKVDFEFRTTLACPLHTEEDMHAIGEWLSGKEKFFLQTYIDSGDVISPNFVGYDKKETELLLNVLKNYIPNAQIRG